MGGSRWRLRVALFLAVGLGITGIWLVAYGVNVFKGLELESVDARFALPGERAPPRDIVLVRIDDVTFN